MTPKPIAVGADVTAAFLNDMKSRYDRSVGQVDVVSSAALTSVYSKSVTAGHMSSDRALVCLVGGDYLNNSGSNQTLYAAISFGGTVAWEDTTSLIPSGTNRAPFGIWFVLQNLTASSQYLFGKFMLGRCDVNPATTGFGGLDNAAGVWDLPLSGASAIDTAAAARTLDVSVQHSASNANLSCRKQFTCLWLD